MGSTFHPPAFSTGEVHLKAKPYPQAHNPPPSQGLPLQLEGNLRSKAIPGLKSSPLLGSWEGALWSWQAMWGDGRISTHLEVKAAGCWWRGADGLYGRK